MPEVYILSFSKDKKPYYADEVQGTPFESEAALLTYLQQNPLLAKRYTSVIYKIEDTQQNVDAVVDLLVLRNKSVSLLNHKNVNVAQVSENGQSLVLMPYQSFGRLEQAKKDESVARPLVEHHAKLLKPADLISLLAAHRAVWPNKEGPMKWLKRQGVKLTDILLEKDNWNLCETVFKSPLVNDLSQTDLSDILSKHENRFIHFYGHTGYSIPLLKHFMEERARNLSARAKEDPKALAELSKILVKLEGADKKQFVDLILLHIQKSGAEGLKAIGLFELNSYSQMEILSDSKIAIPLLKSAAFVDAAGSINIAHMLNLHKFNPELHEAVRNKELPPRAMPSHVRKDLIAQAQATGKRRVGGELGQAIDYFGHSSMFRLIDCEQTDSPQQGSGSSPGM